MYEMVGNELYSFLTSEGVAPERKEGEGKSYIPHTRVGLEHGSQ